MDPIDPALYQVPDGPYYANRYSKAVGVSNQSTGSHLRQEDNAGLLFDHVMNDHLDDKMHSGADTSGPPNLNHCAQFEEGHSNAGLQGNTTNQITDNGILGLGLNPDLKPALFSPHHGLDNASASNTFGNHHDADSNRYPTAPNHKFEGGHSNTGLQGNTANQITENGHLGLGFNPDLNPALFSPHHGLDNASASNTFGNHHMTSIVDDSVSNRYPTAPNHKFEGGHSNTGLQGNTTNQITDNGHLGLGLNPDLNPALSSPHYGLDNASASNTLGNHHMTSIVDDSDSHRYPTAPSHDEKQRSFTDVGFHEKHAANSSRAKARARTTTRKNPLNPEEALVADRLWNFEAVHDGGTYYDRIEPSEPLLTDDEFATAVQRPYDPSWINHHALDRSKFVIPPSNLKFEKLFLDSVLTVGDIFVLGDVNEGIKHNLRNTALVVSVSRASNWWPDLQIKSTKEPSGYRVLTRCKGTQDLMKGLSEEDTRLHHGKCGAWVDFSMFRNGVNLGTLASIRQEYHFWVDLVDEWAARNNQRRRARRGGRKFGLVWRNSRFFKLLEDGTTEPLEDAHQLHPVNRHHNCDQRLQSNSVLAPR